MQKPKGPERNWEDAKSQSQKATKSRINQQKAEKQKAKKPRSRKAKKPRSQKAKKPRSQEAKKPRSQEAKKPKSGEKKLRPKIRGDLEPKNWDFPGGSPAKPQTEMRFSLSRVLLDTTPEKVSTYSPTRLAPGEAVGLPPLRAHLHCWCALVPVRADGGDVELVRVQRGLEPGCADGMASALREPCGFGCLVSLGNPKIGGLPADFSLNHPQKQHPQKTNVCLP